MPFNALPPMVLRFCGVDKPTVPDHQNLVTKMLDTVLQENRVLKL